MAKKQPVTKASLSNQEPEQNEIINVPTARPAKKVNANNSFGAILKAASAKRAERKTKYGKN